jgi:hypothetical protein
MISLLFLINRPLSVFSLIDASPEPLGHVVVLRAAGGPVTESSHARSHIYSNGNHTIGSSDARRNYLLSGYRRQENSGAPLPFSDNVRRTLTTAQDGPATDFQSIPQFLRKNILPYGFFC